MALRSSLLLRFFAGGALILLSKGAVSETLGAGELAPQPIEVSAARVEWLKGRHLLDRGRPASARDLAILIEKDVEEEILAREGLSRELHVNDAVSLRRLLTNMRFVGAHDDDSDLLDSAFAMGMHRSDPVVRRRLIQALQLEAYEHSVRQGVTRDQLQRFLDRNVEDFSSAATLRFSHVFFSRAKRGTQAEKAASDTLALIAGSSADQAKKLGDAWRFGGFEVSGSTTKLAKTFGCDFAAEVAALEVGNWSGPIESTAGFHLVSLLAKQDAQPPGLDEVYESVRYFFLRARGEEELGQRLAEQRERYSVIVAQGTGAAESGS